MRKRTSKTPSNPHAKIPVALGRNPHFCADAPSSRRRHAYQTDRKALGAEMRKGARMETDAEESGEGSKLVVVAQRVGGCWMAGPKLQDYRFAVTSSR